MNYLQRRIKALEREITARTGGTFTVYYKDGTTRKIYPGDAIKLSLEEADKIERFEEDRGGMNAGILEGLANALLLPGDPNEEDERKVRNDGNKEE